MSEFPNLPHVKLQFPEWQLEYEEALFEPNPANLPHREPARKKRAVSGEWEHQSCAAFRHVSTVADSVAAPPPCRNRLTKMPRILPTRGKWVVHFWRVGELYASGLWKITNSTQQDTRQKSGHTLLQLCLSF